LLDNAKANLSNVDGDISATFTGRFSLPNGSVVVAGNYVDSKNWSLDAHVATLMLSGDTSLTTATIVVANVDGTIAAFISGNVVFGSATITVAGLYLDESNWTLGAQVANLTLAPTISLTTATIVVAKSDGVFDGHFSGTLTIGATTLTLAGAYTNNSNWSIAGSIDS
jgi:hypothetical protein